MKKIMEQILSDYGISPFPSQTSEAMVYIKYQKNNPMTYNPTQALEIGTMFPCLDKPFYGSRCGEEGNNE